MDRLQQEGQDFLSLAIAVASPRFQAALANPEDPAHVWVREVEAYAQETFSRASVLLAKGAAHFTAEELTVNVNALLGEYMRAQLGGGMGALMGGLNALQGFNPFGGK